MVFSYIHGEKFKRAREDQRIFSSWRPCMLWQVERGCRLELQVAFFNKALCRMALSAPLVAKRALVKVLLSLAALY